MFFGIMKKVEINIDRNKAPSIYKLINNISYLITLRKLDEPKTYNTENNNIVDNYSSINNQDNSSIYLEKERSESILKSKNNSECYISCETCNEEGNYTKHNCLTCSSNYSYQLNIDESINCYNSCDYYTYYNSSDNNSYCTPNSLCPEDFNKLIKIKNRCKDNCKNDGNYLYEFRHECY